MPEHPPDRGLQTCRKCNDTFDLSRQNYYDNLCPACVPEERTWPLCWGCGEKVDPDEAVYRTEHSRRGDSAQIPYHPDCAPVPRGPP